LKDESAEIEEHVNFTLNQDPQVMESVKVVGMTSLLGNA